MVCSFYAVFRYKYEKRHTSICTYIVHIYYSTSLHILVPQHRIEPALHSIYPLLSNSLFKGYSAQDVRGGTSNLGIYALRQTIIYCYDEEILL